MEYGWSFLAIDLATNELILSPDPHRVVIVNGLLSAENSEVRVKEMTAQILVKNVIGGSVLHFMFNRIQDDPRDQAALVFRQLYVSLEFKEQFIAFNFVITGLWIIHCIMKPQT